MMVAELDAAKAFLNVLRSKRRFKLLVDAAEACIQNGLNDPQIVIWQAQGLIETGKAGPARISLSNLVANIPVGGEVFREIKGLLGRAWKQTFFDTRDKSSPEAQDAIRTSFVEYKAGFDAGSPWAGVNLLALSAFAKRNGIPMPADIDLRPLAITVLGLLEDERHDNWYHGSRPRSKSVNTYAMWPPRPSNWAARSDSSPNSGSSASETKEAMASSRRCARRC
jgi:hypothetical protein